MDYIYSLRIASIAWGRVSAARRVGQTAGLQVAIYLLRWE